MGAAGVECELDAGPIKRSADSNLPGNPAKRSRFEQSPPRNAEIGEASDAALLYDLAYASWRASHLHFTQALIPPEVTAEVPNKLPAIRLPDPLRPTEMKGCSPDSQALERALHLQVLALDALVVALRLPGLTGQEKVVIGLLYGQIGFQVVTALRDPAIKRHCVTTLENGGRLDSEKLLRDVQEELGQCLSIARQSNFLTLVKQSIEVLAIRLLMYEGKLGIAKKMLKQASVEAKDHPAQVFALQFLLLEHEEALGPSGTAMACEDALAYATNAGFQEVHEVLLVARVRLHFRQRRWDLLSKSIDDLGVACCWTDANGFAHKPTTKPNPGWQTNMAMHYLLFRALWDGRLGQPQRVRQFRKEAFSLMDDAMDRQVFSQARAMGGLYEIHLRDNGTTASLLVQSTPPNLLYVLTYLVAMTSGRDISGKDSKAKTLVFSKGMQATERYALADDMWDACFALQNSLDQVTGLRRQICRVRVEVLLEQAHAYMYRSAYPKALDALEGAHKLAQKHTDADLGSSESHVLLLYGQLAHLLGRTESASRYYKAGVANLVPGSELGTVLTINAMACEGAFESLGTDHLPSPAIRHILDSTKASTSADLVAISHFISGLLESGTGAKTRFRSAWEATHVNGNRLLYALLYAFLVSVDVLGDKSVIQQAETGMSLAKGLGGLDHPDGIGQASLGYWFAKTLASRYTRSAESDPTTSDTIRDNLKQFALRNEELMKYGLEVFSFRET